MIRLLGITEVKRLSGDGSSYNWGDVKTDGVHQATLSRPNNALEKIPLIGMRFLLFNFTFKTIYMRNQQGVNYKHEYM